MYISPGVRFDWHDNQTLTVHLTGKPSLRFEQLSPEERAWLCTLTGPAHADSLPHQPLTAGIEHLRKQLISTGFARHQTPRGLLHAKPDKLPSEALDIHTRGLHIRQTLRRRETATVLVHGIDRISLAVMKELVRSGITRFIIEPGTFPLPIESLTSLHQDLLDAGTTTPIPHGPGQLRTAVTQYLTQFNSNVTILPDSHKPSVAVLSHSVHSPASSHARSLLRAHLMGSGLPHLLTQFDGLTAQIGPFIIPGLARAGQCSEQTYDAPAQPGACATVIARLSAAVAAGQIIRFVEGYVPATAHGRIEFDIHSLIPRHIPLHEHGDCLCSVDALTHA